MSISGWGGSVALSVTSWPGWRGGSVGDQLAVVGLSVTSWLCLCLRRDSVGD